MMKTFWKRTLAVWLAAALLAAASPAVGIAGMTNLLSVTAAAETLSGSCGANDSNVTWSLDTQTGALTISGAGAMKDYSSGSYSTPWYLLSVKTATIGSGVTRIGNYAFSGCTKLARVTIPDSVTIIGGSAFYGCTGLTSMTIPDNVTCIGRYAFSHCTGLTSVTIPDNVTSIGWSAFEGCTGLTSMTIPDSVTYIGGYAFRNCSGLANVTFNAVNCTSMDITHSPVFSGCNVLQTVTIGEGVTAIPSYAFYGCTSLTSVTIPDSVTSIGDGAFSEVDVGNIVYTGSATGSPWGATHHYRQIIVRPTCTEGGFTTYTCSVCGHSYTTDETPALGHAWDSGIVTKEPTCFEVGFTTYTCTRCGSECTEPIAMIDHTYAAEMTEPTCTDGGFTTYTCSVCGDSYMTDETPALGHVFAEWTVVKTPSFTSEGSEKRVCTRCGFEETRPIDVLPLDAPAVTAADAIVGCSTGRLVRVSVDLANNPGIIAARLHIGYDPQQLRLVSVENGTVFGASTFQCGGRLTDVPFTVLWSDDYARSDNTANGTLVTLTFEVQPSATVGETTVTVTCDDDSTFNAALLPVSLYMVNSTVSIVDCTPGDASGEGKISLLDAVIISRYLAGGWDLTINEVNADVNGDGVLDLKDVVLIRRFLVGGWDVTLI